MKLFDWLKKRKGTDEKENKIILPWISPENNVWKKELLDLRPISEKMLSFSEDPRIAENAVSYNNEDGSSFWGVKPANDPTITTHICFPIENTLYPGVLFTPRVMENKWAIYFDGEYIYFIRSWQREVLVIARTEQKDGMLIVTNITGKFLDEKEPDFTESIFNFLLISHVLNENIPAPLPGYMKEDPHIAGSWAFSAYGNMAHMGIFDYLFKPKPTKFLYSHTALHIAAVRGEIEKVNEYLAKGIPYDCFAGDGATPVHWAVSAGEGVDVLKRFIQLGADPDIRTKENVTPLMLAVQSNISDYIQILLNAGASVNATDEKGFTALHRAAEMGRIELVQQLLEHGADKTMIAQEHTALSLAEMRKHKEIIRLLKD